MKCVPREGPSKAGLAISKEPETCIQRASAGLEAASRVAAMGRGDCLHTGGHVTAASRQTAHGQLLLEGGEQGAWSDFVVERLSQL